MNIPRLYREATTDLQDVGVGIRRGVSKFGSNLARGQKRLNAKKMKTYGSIDPFAGVGGAFMSAFNKRLPRKPK